MAVKKEEHGQVLELILDKLENIDENHKFYRARQYASEEKLQTMHDDLHSLKTELQLFKKVGGGIAAGLVAITGLVFSNIESVIKFLFKGGA